MKITVLFNTVKSKDYGDPEDLLADDDSVKTATAIHAALQSLGHTVDLFEVDENSINHLDELQTDFLFNQAYGVGSLPKSESQVTAALDKLTIPFSGSDSVALDLSNDKLATKKLLVEHHLPTPAFQIFAGTKTALNPDLHFPVIVKLAREHCSLGLNENSVISDPSKLVDQANKLAQRYRQEVYAEDYIDGREFNVAVMGNGDSAKSLPISEITFGPSFTGHYKIVDFAAKWLENSSAYAETPGICPAILPDELTAKLMSIAENTYRLTQCRDYARVDFRLSPDGEPYILEVNANPGIGPGDGFMRSARASGLDYPQFLQKIVDFALARYN